MLNNTITPRIFIAATHQDVGKTTVCIGLLRLLQRHFQKVGYIKPIGQRYVEVDGLRVDEDTLLINETYRLDLPYEAMSPITIDQHFTRRYLSGEDPTHLQQVLIDAFDRTAWEHDFVLVEGSGHAGVGSIINLSNARVAELLKCKVIMVTEGGLGRPLDELAMNVALFEKHGVEVVGVVMNQVRQSKRESLLPYAERGLKQMGLKLLGVIPLHHELARPTLGQMVRHLKGEFLCGGQFNRRRISRVVIGAGTAKNIFSMVPPGSLIVAPGDREDIILSVLEHLGDSQFPKLAGFMLCDGLRPQPGLQKLMLERGFPFIALQQNLTQIVEATRDMTVKTEPGDQEKIQYVQELVETHVDFPSVLAASTPVT